MQLTDSVVEKKPRLWVAVLPIIFLVIALSLNVYYLGSDALGGASQILLIMSALLCFGIAKFETGVTWASTEKTIVKHIGDSTPAILILFMIGALSGTWMLSGVVPTMIYYGLQLIDPATFLLTACIISSIVSVAAGSSWATVATIGVAMMGVGKALGYSDGWIAGAVISGAYFGDKVSPLSETTNLAANITGTPLFKHIRFMMYTTVPNYIITLLIFFVAGLVMNTEGVAQMTDFTDALKNSYMISPWLLLIPVGTFVLISKKMPTLIILMISSVVAAIVAVMFQAPVNEMVSGIQGDKMAAGVMSAFQAMYGSVTVDTGYPALNDLVATKGMGGMLNTVWLILAAMTFGGCMEAGGMLRSISDAMIRMMKNTFSTVGCTTFSCLFLNVTTADQYISILLPGKMFASIYKERGYDTALLSRTLEDSATVTGVLIPWNACGLTQATVLNVSTMTYLPYCFFNILSPITTLLIAAIGYKIKKSDSEVDESPVFTGATEPVNCLNAKIES
ncbi:MAG: Na+/H+ antiporter NhaC family protein [Bacteroidales bacterium]